MTTLIIGQSPDPHIERVKSHLEEKGKPVLFIDRYKLTNHISISYSDIIPSVRFIDEQGKQIDSVSIDKVWWRLKPYLFFEHSGVQALPFEKFRQREWVSVLSSLESLMPACDWMNSPKMQQLASKKVRQLKLAKELGLSIPKTIITNRAEQVLDYFGAGEKIVYKTLDTFVAPPDYIVFTTEVSREVIEQNKTQISVTPCIFQEKVEKKYELRITVVGEKVFAVKIDSQKTEQTQTDWRKNQFLPIYSKINIPEALTAKLMMIHKKLGLVYGAYDFIIDQKGEAIFLECNPGGQWLWMENQIDNLPIAGTIADKLI